MGLGEDLCLPKMTLSLTSCWDKKWDLVYSTKLRNLKVQFYFFFLFILTKNMCYRRDSSRHYLHIWVKSFDQTEPMEKEQEDIFDFTPCTLSV